MKNRGEKIYFGYLQMWTGKSIIAPYSQREREGALIPMPLFSKELEQGMVTADYEQVNESDDSIVKEVCILQ